MPATDNPEQQVLKEVVSVKVKDTIQVSLLERKSLSSFIKLRWIKSLFSGTAAGALGDSYEDLI